MDKVTINFFLKCKTCNINTSIWNNFIKYFQILKQYRNKYLMKKILTKRTYIISDIKKRSRDVKKQRNQNENFHSTQTNPRILTALYRIICISSKTINKWSRLLTFEGWSPDLIQPYHKPLFFRTFSTLYYR